MTLSPSPPVSSLAAADAVAPLAGRPPPEALIEEARRRARRRRLRNALALLAAVLLGIGSYAGLTRGGSTGPAQVFQPAAPPAPVAAGGRLPQQLAFSANDTIWIAGRDGSVRRLTRDPRPLSAIAWTPDGRRLLASLGGDPFQPGTSLAVVELDGTVGPVVARNVVSSAVSPDGRSIAFQRAHWRAESGLNIYVVPTTGGPTRRVATNGRDGSGSPTRLAWSPDGGGLLYSGTGPAGSGLYQVGAFGGSPTRLPLDRSIGAPANASYSPDGSRIAFEARPGSPSRGASFLGVVRRDGTGLRRVARPAMLPEWSPDGRRLGFMELRGQDRGWRMATVKLDGTGVRRLGGCTCDLRGPGLPADAQLVG